MIARRLTTPTDPGAVLLIACGLGRFVSEEWRYNEMSLIIGFRPKNPIQYDYDTDGEATRRYHPGKCVTCDNPVEWEQHCEVWIEDDAGTMQPDWEGSGSWGYQCPHCGSMVADPYEDGLLRVWYPDDERYEGGKE